MSSKPSEEGVAELREAIHARNLLAEQVRLYREAAAKLPNATDDLMVASRRVIILLEGMDLKSDGNMGWEGRMIWFLAELDRQAGAKK